MGILRRAFERGKALPKKLERALKIQAGLALPDGQITDIDAYHINQRDEGIDLQGVSGALMATSNMQMQTFVTQASENTEGFDGYNGDLTGDVAATLGVNCGMSTGRNGVIAFAANQRDEVRELHDVAGALNAQPGIKQQTFVAGFSAGAGASAGSIGYHESVAPTLKAGASGNSMPSVLCINDQGGQVMEISENMTGTLRAQEHGHQPLVYENHGIDSRYRQMEEVAPTMSARYGTGGNNVPLVEQEPVICIAGNAIDRQPQNGGNGIGYQQDIAYTLTATDHLSGYSYLPKSVKAQVDAIVERLAQLPEVAACYDQWWQLKDEIAGYYGRNTPPRQPLTQRKEFRSLKNWIIREAEDISFSPSADSTEPEEKQSTEKTPPIRGSVDVQLVGETVSARHIPANAVMRLLHHMGQIFRTSTPVIPPALRIDSKRRRRLQEKRMAMGHKRDDHEDEQLHHVNDNTM